jgi:hypothetical protein
MSVQVQASFKKDQKHLDGIDHVRKDLIDNPLTPRVAVIVFDVASITHDVLDGSDTPKIRLRQAEVLDGADAMKAIDMLNASYGRRTGREDSQASLFDDWPGPAGQLTEVDEQAAEAMERLDARRAAEAGGQLLDDGSGSGTDTTEEEDTSEGDDGVPWIPGAPEQAAADWPAEQDADAAVPPVDFSGSDDTTPPATTRRRKGR